MRRILITVLILFLLVGCSSGGTTPAKPVVRAVFFYSETCPYCHIVMEQVLPPLQKQYGDQLEIKMLVLSDQANYERWLKAMDAYQVPADWRGVPMIFIGDHVLVGSGQIPERLPGLIEQYLKAGGVDYPEILK